jgi:hypothetical protein
MRALFLSTATALLTGFVAVPVGAATANATFNVNITLSPPRVDVGTGVGVAVGVCVSSTLSAQTNALVKVVCGSDQFVSIEPLQGKPFLGTHGGAYRYVFAPNTVIPYALLDASDPHVGRGTVTSLRVLNLNALHDKLELLVSF